MSNLLYYGDNLDVLRGYVADESIDLIYLDPPFNSAQDYNVLFREQNGTRSAAQIKAFEDTWIWDQAAALAYQEIVESGGKVSQAMQGFRAFLGDNDMLAYLSMMAPRLVELRRVLKVTGSIYLHCDPTASHYLKMLMDAIFSAENFRNEIIWKRTTASSSKARAVRFGSDHDVILYYSKSQEYHFEAQYLAYSAEYISRRFTGADAKGRYKDAQLKTYSEEGLARLRKEGRLIVTKGGKYRYKMYLNELRGIPIDDIWIDIPPINSMAQERLGYPTQKPEALLERILKASSSEGDIVLDPFCGCGTTISAAQTLRRHWVGIDITHLAIALIRHRLQTTFGNRLKYQVVGEPNDIAGAKALSQLDRFQFQWWALGLVGARPTEQKKGADQGIDGRLYFHDEGTKGKTKQLILSVKSGGVSVRDVRDLRGVLDREKAAIGVLITLEDSTRPMRSEATSAGVYASSWGTKHSVIQILTVADLLNGRRIDYPAPTNVTLKSAPQKLTHDGSEQIEVDMED